MLTSHRPEGELEVFVNSSTDLHIQCARMGRGQVRGKEQEINISQVMKEDSLCKVLGFLLYLARAIEVYQAGRDTINCSF